MANRTVRTEQQRATNKRSLAIVLYSGGATLQEVGDALGVTRERVRQYLAQAGIDARHYGASVDPGEIMRQIRRSDVTNYSQVRGATGEQPHDVVRVVESLGLRPAVDRLFRLRRVAKLLSQLRELSARTGRTLTSDDLREAGLYGLCRTRFGTHSRALHAAGLHALPRGRPECAA